MFTNVKALCSLLALVWLSQTGTAQVRTNPLPPNAAANNRTILTKSIQNITRLNSGGAVSPGDIVEVRAVFFIINSTGTTSYSQARFVDTVPTNTTYQTLSRAVRTNEGNTNGVVVSGVTNLVSNGTYPSDVFGASGSRGGYQLLSSVPTVVINLGAGAGNDNTNASGGTLNEDNQIPQQSGGLQAMATYRVQVSPSVTPGTIINFGGGRIRLGTTDYHFLPLNVVVQANNSDVPRQRSLNNISIASNGTFGSGTANDGPALPSGVNYTLLTGITASNQLGDDFYAVVKNTANNNTNTGATVIGDEMFNQNAANTIKGGWDVRGDHTGAANGLAGNPAAKGNAQGGYMLMVNSANAPGVIFTQDLTNLCPSSPYNGTFWMINLCPNCGAQGFSGTNTGTAVPANRTYPGVLPNVSVQIAGNQVYQSGNVPYDNPGSTSATWPDATRTNTWKFKRFEFNTAAATTYSFSIVDNSPGGGGNDWALDDIRISQAIPDMLNLGEPLPPVCPNTDLQIRTNVSSLRISGFEYNHYQWQRSTNNGATWTNFGAAGVVNDGTRRNYVAALTIPSANTALANNGELYRLVVATTNANLSGSCAVEGLPFRLNIVNSSSFCRPPVALNIQNEPMTNDLGNTPIKPLVAVDQDGSITSYTILTLPTAAQGVLRLAGSPVTVNQVLTPAQVSQLTFDPEPTFTGTATFTYNAVDNSSFVSNTGVVALPVINMPPVANNLLAHLPNANVVNNIPGLSGSDADGTVTAFIIGASVPTAAQGLLTYFNGTSDVPVAANQTLTPAQAATLKFTPAVGAANGSFAFTYTARDNNNQLSAPATYTINLYTGAPNATQPPVADNIVNPPLPNSANATPINRLMAMDANGTITSYTVVTIPPASQGVLQYRPGGVGALTNVAANQTLTPAEAASLHFDPVATFVGTASFTYRATDNSSLQSNVANYSIPVTNLPPVANPILSPALNRTDPSRPIPDLAGFDGDGTIVSYTIVNVPVAADGVLSYRIGGNGTLTPVTAGQTLTTAEAASLEFDPATSAGSFVNFSYRANDNNGQTSQPATYTIPMRQYIPPVVQDVRFNRTLAKDGSAAAPTPTSYIPTSASWATSAATIAVTNLQDPIASDADGTIARYEILTLPDRSANGEGRLRFPCNSVCQAALPTGTLFTQFCDVNGNTSATAGSGFTSGNDGCLPTTARYRVNSDDPNYVEIVKTDIPIPLTFAQMEGLQFNPRNPADGKVVNFSYTAVDNDGYVGNTARYFIPISSTSVSTPPYALDKQGALIQNTAVLATVATLEAYDNADVGTPAGNPGTINRYQIETVPTPAEGTLFLNGNPVIAGQTIAVADAGNLKFTPNVNFAGVASFTYIAFDNDQVVSGQTQKNSNVAVVRIPVTTLSLPDAAAQYTTMPNTNAATAIPSLAVSISGGGTLSPFVVHNVPTAAQGVLTYNNGTADVPVVVGGPITLAQASTLKFDPAPGFVGNFVLTYSASTFEGVFSNPAAFTIRVTDPPPAALDVVAPAIVKVSPGIATSLSGSPLVGTDNTTITEYRISSIPSAASGTLSVCSPTCVPVVAGQTLTPTQAAQLSFTPAPGFTGTAAVFNYEAIDNNSQKSNVATYTIPLSEPEINITATPVCIKDVPYMNYTVTSNFNLTGRTADITWITGTPQALPPTSPVSPIVNQVVLNSQPLTVGGGGFSATGQVIWAGAAKNANDEGIDWPAWVFSGGQWLNQEDGFSGYRTNPTFRVTINPSAEVSAVGYPPSSPLCLTEPPIAVTGTVWKDADGSGKINVNNIQTGTEAGTNATPNTGSQVLYANAIARGKNGNPDLVIETAIVQPDGTYEFNQIQRQYLTTDYDFEVVLSTTQGTIGSSIIPGAGAPNQWETTVAQRPIASSNANIFNLDLGAQQLPETDAKVQNINGNLTVGQPYLLDDSPLTGSDPEDGLKGPGNTFRISSLPVGANLYYNGVLITQADVTAGTGTAIITNYNPALLDIRFTTTSLASRVFTYAAIDLANGVDPTPANYTVNPPSVLPATGLSLTGTLSSSQVNLVWTTVTEANTSYFVVERSADGSRFSSLGNVTAAGNSTAMRSYHFEDKQLQQSQLWYYRIKLVDLNGEVKYSNVVSIRISANAGSLVVYPNPVESRFYVTLPAIGRYKLDLVNAQGQQVWTKQVTVNNTLTAETVERNGLATGVYMLRITTADGKQLQGVKLLFR